MMRSAAVLVAAIACGGALGAQAARPVADDTTLVDVRTRADSLAALEALNASVRRDPGDRALWHRKGMLAAALLAHPRSFTSMQAADIRLADDADSSLRIAAAARPPNARYLLDAALFFRSPDAARSRLDARRYAESAYSAARLAHDDATASAARDFVGMTAWRHYEQFANRYTPKPGGRNITPEDFEPMARDTQQLRAFVVVAAQPPPAGSIPGESYMRDAEAAFLEASAADPTAELPRRHVYMVLAERARWDELRRLASTHAAARPGSAIARLALGLADHRLALDADAATAFDSGLALLEPDERSRLTRLSRLLAPASEVGHYDSVRFAASGGAQRAAAERAFWLANTPLALRSVNPHRLEFLARVVFAELRWTAEEFGVRGADTDRGDIYVRYGPPERVVGLGAEAQKIQIDVTPEFQSRGVLRKPSPDSTSAPALGVSGELWMYPAGYSFLFVGPPAGGVTRLTGDFAGVAESQRASFPVIWSMRRYADELDSVPMFAARFRAPGDSMDLVVSAALPMAPLLGEVGRGRASVDVGLTLTTPDAEVAVRDSVRLRVAASDSSGARQWTRRLGAGPYAYRVEGYGVASGRAARGSAALGARPTRGFGTSDLLLAASVTPPASDRDAAPRWSDYPAVLNAGVFRRGAPVALLWETYALAAGADSISRYRVSVAVSPASDGAGTTLAARVLAGAASALGRSSERAGRRSLVYDRELHAAPAAVDYLSLDLSGAASGEYVVRVTVEDSITHRSATTTAAFRIIE